MEILEQIKEHDVTDYDFMFNTGSKMAAVVDHDAGDTVTELDDRYVVDIAAKPSLTDPDESVDAEKLIVYKSLLAFVAIRNRKMVMATEEQKLATRKFIHELAKGIQ